MKVLVPKLLFGNARFETLFRGRYDDSGNGVSQDGVPKQEFGNEVFYIPS